MKNKNIMQVHSIKIASLSDVIQFIRYKTNTFKMYEYGQTQEIISKLKAQTQPMHG